MRTAVLVLLTVVVVSSPAAPWDRTVDVPAEVEPFVERGTVAIDVQSADLNGDGRTDVVLVLEKQKASPSDPDMEENQRPLLILVRQPDGSLKLRKRNERVVYCSSCGGIMGDPFQGVRAERNAFTVTHYGGSAWRWSNEYTFKYSRRDDTWQLVRVAETSFHVSDAANPHTRMYRPPKDFGKIDFVDFDPENWKGQGPR